MRKQVRECGLCIVCDKEKSKCPSARERMNKLCGSHRRKYYAATTINGPAAKVNGAVSAQLETTVVMTNAGD